MFCSSNKSLIFDNSSTSAGVGTVVSFISSALAFSLLINFTTKKIVNPTIKNKDKEKTTYEEGCLSVPDYFAEVDRPKYCEVEYLDYNGESKVLKADGLLATCIQHEMDHLEGILFIDYLSKLKKTMIVKKLSKRKNPPDRIIV